MCKFALAGDIFLNEQRAGVSDQRAKSGREAADMTEEYTETPKTIEVGTASYESDALRALTEYRAYYSGALRRAVLRLAIASVFLGPIGAASIAYGVDRLGSPNGVLLFVVLLIVLMMAIGFSVSAARHWGDSIWSSKWLEMAQYNHRLEIRFSHAVDLGERRVNLVGSELEKLRDDWARLKQEAEESQTATLDTTRRAFPSQTRLQSKPAGRRREPHLDNASDRIGRGEDYDAVFLELCNSGYYTGDKNSRDSFKKAMDLRARRAAN